MKKESLSDLARDWWEMGLRSLAAMVSGVIILVAPFPYADALLRVFGGYLLTDGVITLIMATLRARQRKSWAKSALNGLLGVLFGVANLIGGGLPLEVRADLIAFRTLLVGVSSLITARRLRVAPSDALLQVLLTLAGAGSVVFSLIIAIGPRLKVHFLDEIGWLIALYLFSFSLLLLIISFWLWLLNRKLAAAATA
jgi:uncharacterized membrane protein HdeD (DUF308 family)